MFIVRKYIINLYSLRNRPEKIATGLFFYPFLKLLQINYIVSHNVCILYILMISEH